MHDLGFNRVCDIFSDWENVKDEILLPERKEGSGNGTIHVFLGAADPVFEEEFRAYYTSVRDGGDTSQGTINITHYFLVSNVISMLGYVCKYFNSKGEDFSNEIKTILSEIDSAPKREGLLSTYSLFKLSEGSNKLRPYFKQFDPNGVFPKIIRRLLLPETCYKISLYKNNRNEYAAFWLLGFKEMANFEANASSLYISKRISIPRQIIYYGAPGTGKSYAINKETKGESVIRTTFHPDSDYSTFVGAYKPTTKKVYVRNSVGGRVKENGSEVTEDRIVYEFVEQAFLQAYVLAWKSYVLAGDDAPQKEFLIIEEINRGNCAQIFGDIFQLLDRNDSGFSDYPIHADKDMKKQLAEEFKSLKIAQESRINAIYGRKDVVSKVLSGDILLLPDNLYIWATMNTSDQSLFPIDSAFKRRWDWKYIPISLGYDENGNVYKWAIDVNGKKYSWWSFIKEINARIRDVTNSEDKKLGFFFCKADNGIITADKFVNKVLVYLWNDVFKDYDFEANLFIGKDGKVLSFDKFFTTVNNDSFVNQDNVELFLNNLGVELKPDSNEDEEIEDDDGNTENSTDRDYTKYSINGNGSFGKNSLAAECVKEYISENPKLTANEVLNDWKDLLKLVPHFMESEEEHENRTDKYKDKRSDKINCGGNTFLYVERDGYGNNGKVDDLIKAINSKNFGIAIEKV